jgi:phosphatidylethanolamine/phosphatidyl-N-methylethanolamine N-methyltransferase
MSGPSNGTGMREHVLFFSRFLKSPRTVGAVTASSRALAAAMVEHLDLSQPGHIVELGPGTGAFTSAIVERLGPNTRFLALDIDQAFVERINARWPAVECVCASAERLPAVAADHQMLPIDHIVSGLPFVSLPPQVTQQIIESIAASLRPGGTFTTFQYVPGYGFPSAVSFRRNMARWMHSQPRVRLVVRNMPPVLVMTWRKG